MTSKRGVTLILLFAFIAVSFIIVLCSTAKKEQGLKLKKPLPSVNDYTADTTSSKWFGIPVIEIERVNQKEGKYSVMLENGVFFYTNKKYSIGEIGAWINDSDSVVFQNPEIKKLW